MAGIILGQMPEILSSKQQHFKVTLVLQQHWQPGAPVSRRVDCNPDRKCIRSQPKPPYTQSFAIASAITLRGSKTFTLKNSHILRKK